MSGCVADYFRCREEDVPILQKAQVAEDVGYFRFAANVLYGGYCGPQVAKSPSDVLRDAFEDTVLENGQVTLPFNLNQVVDCLREERYAVALSEQPGGWGVMSRAYYLLRPLMSVAFRKHLQRLHLKGWKDKTFPHWPVDRTVDNVMGRLLLLSLRASRRESIPFIWFWPDGTRNCAVMTHDVETAVGRDFCGKLMDIDESYGVTSSFHVVPEERYEVTQEFLNSITGRGFEVGVQDLNHDGLLFQDREQFKERVARINGYGRQWKASGFRAGVLYRKQEWFGDFEFSYDSSIPNVAHLDPQHGGCCTVMPFFIGNLVELPVTATQDYSLFHILGDYSLNLWKWQMELIMEKHGLMNFIIHPDYIIGPREQAVYRDLLGYIAQLREQKGTWVAAPVEVNRWWRQRAQLQLVETPDGLQIRGSGSERASIAYASERDGELVLTLNSPGAAREHTQRIDVGDGMRSVRSALSASPN